MSEPELLMMTVEQLQRQVNRLQKGVGRLQRVESAGVYFDVSVYGARGDGATDDSLAIYRACLAASTIGGAGIYFPPGTYIITPNVVSPGDEVCIPLGGLSNLKLFGAGIDSTTIKLSSTYDWASLEPDAHMFLLVDCQHITFEDMTIDGNWEYIETVNPTINTQMHGLAIRSDGVYGQAAGQTRDIFVNRVRFYNLRGDSAFLIGDSANTVFTENVTFRDCEHEATGRSGIAFQRNLKHIQVLNNHFKNISDTCLDCEPTGASASEIAYLTVDGCTFDKAGGTGGIAISISGSATAATEWVKVTNCTFLDQVVQGVRQLRVIITGNHFDNSALACISFGSNGEGASKLIITDNELTGYAADADTGIITLFRQASDNPDDIIIANNLITNLNTNRYGIYLGSCTNVTVMGNSINCTESSNAAVSCFATAVEADGIIITNNRILGEWNTGVHVGGAFDQNYLDISHNFISGPTYGIRFQMSGGVFNQLPICIGNNINAVTTNIRRDSASVPIGIVIGGNVGDRDIVLLVSGSPESVLARPIGALCVAADDGDYFKKTSGTGNTGWVAV